MDVDAVLRAPVPRDPRNAGTLLRVSWLPFHAGLVGTALAMLWSISRVRAGTMQVGFAIAVNVFLFVFMAVLGLLVGYSDARARALYRTGEVFRAKVLHLRDIGVGRFAEVSFAHGDEEVRCRIQVQGDLAKGTTVPLLYDPRTPSQCALATEAGLSLGAAVHPGENGYDVIGDGSRSLQG